jgi:2-hydroxychromene-2-carboxylate isomerase
VTAASSPPPSLAEVPLRILLDVRHPLAYLALQPAVAFARERGIAVDWLPLSVPSLNPPSDPGPDDDRGIRHRRHRARALAREIETYAAAQGLAIREAYRDGDARALNLGWLWVRERHPDRLVDFLTRAFREYWSLALDASGPGAVARLLDALEADGGAFLAWCDTEGPLLAESVAAALRERGWFQVPAFVVEDEVFYGRQHLPMIRWILDGRSGPVPI